MKAIILVGGEGTRLRPLTYSIVKSMVPVLNRPFIEHVIRNLAAHGVDEVVLAMGYKPDSIYEYFKNEETGNVRITYSMEERPLGTAGAVRNAAGHVDGTFFVLNGDTFSDIDFSDMLSFHRRNHAMATIALTHVDDPTRFGVVETGEDGRVRAFIEKPDQEKVTSHWINAGVYILEPEVLGRIPENEFYMFERGVFPGMLADKLPVYAYLIHGYWIDMGTPDQYRKLNCDIQQGVCRSTAAISEGINVGKRSRVHGSARLSGQVLTGQGCIIGEDAELEGPVILGNNCRIGKRALISNSVLWDNIKVGAGARVINSILASGANINKGATVKDQTLNPAAPPDAERK